MNTLCLSLPGRNKQQNYEYFISKVPKMVISAMGQLPGRIILSIYNYFKLSGWPNKCCILGLLASQVGQED